MYEVADLQEYMNEIREQVCTRCIERRPGGPPCAPLGKRCGIELNLGLLVDSVHRADSKAIDLYIENFHTHMCPLCPNRTTNQCPCPADYLLLLAAEAIEDVDQRRAQQRAASST